MLAGTPISVEYFPPNTEQGQRSLLRTSGQLAAIHPEYFSITYGAGGSTKDRTFAAVSNLLDAGYQVAPHLSFGGSSDEEIEQLIQRYRALGIRRIVALRGDVPSGIGSASHLRYALELVQYLRKHHGDFFHIEVAAYPEVHPDAHTPAGDLQHFEEKVAAGADGALTQFFYNADAYFDFCERAAKRGIRVPIVPGIMPITNHDNLVCIALKCGAEIPRWIKRGLEAHRDDEDAMRDFGADVVAKLCERLVAGGAPGLHFCALNQAPATLAICERLGLIPTSRQPASA